MPNLNAWIEAQLKRGYTKGQVKAYLAKKGYSPKAVARVDKASSSGVSAKPFMLVGAVAVVAVSLLWVFSMLPFSSAEPRVINDRGSLCSEFKDAEYAISCVEAVSLALTDSPGVVEAISIGPVLEPDFSTDPPARIEKNMWLIDIKLDKPFFHEISKKEITSLQIGIDLNEYTRVINRRFS